MTGIEQIAIAIVQDQDQFLAGPRGSDQVLAGYWEFPGGKIEAGETAEQAAIRECLEETGLSVQIVGQYPGVEHSYEHGTVQLHFFDCRPLAECPPPQAPFRWIPRQALQEYRFPAANESLLALLQESENQSR